jgi:hypothetical protein
MRPDNTGRALTNSQPVGQYDRRAFVYEYRRT